MSSDAGVISRSENGGPTLAPKTRYVSVLAVCAGTVMLAATLLDAQGTKTVRASVQPEPERKLAPDFALKDATGTTVRLSAYRGRVVLLDFWATACGGCVEEIPAFAEIAQTYSRRGLVTVGVSEDILYEDLTGPDEAWRRVKPFAQDHQMRYAVLMGDSQVTAAYAIKALPLTYLLDRRGRIAATYVGVVDRANLEANIQRLLGESNK